MRAASRPARAHVSRMWLRRGCGFGGRKIVDCTRHRAVKLYNARRKPDKIFSAGARLRTRLAVMIPKSDRQLAPVRVCTNDPPHGHAKSPSTPPCANPATPIQHRNQRGENEEH